MENSFSLVRTTISVWRHQLSIVHSNPRRARLCAVGGFDGNRWLNDMYVFDFATSAWTEIQTTGVIPSVRSCPAWAKDETHAYIQGGYDGVERKADFWALDLQTYAWTEMPCLGSKPSPRYFHSCCLYGDRMYLYGGYSGSERLSDMYAYDFHTNHWSKIDCTFGDVPAGRSSLVAQIYENSMYVFGGYNGSTVLNDFFRFSLMPIVVPPTRILDDFRRLIDNPELSDVCFAVEGRYAYANKAILAARSEYFRGMLCGGMKESMMVVDSHDGSLAASVDMSLHDDDDDEGPAGKWGKPIELLDVSYPVFLKVLEFLYTDTVSRDITLEFGIHLLIASEHFMLDRLKVLCEDLLRWDINTETVVSILVASHRYHALGLKELAFEFILANLNNPVVMGCLTDLTAEPDLLLEIIRRSNLSNAAAQTRSPRQQENLSQEQVGPFGGSNDWNARR
jgi:leucine-zipper-like transcriptional regulator 1